MNETKPTQRAGRELPTWLNAFLGAVLFATPLIVGGIASASLDHGTLWDNQSILLIAAVVAIAAWATLWWILTRVERALTQPKRGGRDAPKQEESR